MGNKKRLLKEIIEKYAIDKERVRSDKSLHTLFLQAFPPKDLPDSLSFVSTKGNPQDFDKIIKKYSPYYTYTKTVKTEESKSIKKKVKESLKMKLINPKPFRKILVKLKLIQSNLDD